MFHPSGTRNNLSVNDPRLNTLIDQQSRTLDRAVRKQQVFEIQRYLAEQMYCVPYGAGMRTAGLSPSVRDFFPRSDFGVGAEVVPKVWIDRA
jgi:ABC-type transport system substrate-binding protein